MRVVCSTLDDFLEDVKCQAQTPDMVLQNCIRVSISKREHGMAKKIVVLQASAVMLLESGGEYILEVGVECGTDYEDATQEMNGTKESERLKAKINEVCKELGLVVRPGLIQL